ncbi:MAG: ABC transporter permease [Oscillospiraceae bacterium]|nr:ABC transporter permease [Oscillospiraceae bacterium]
MRTKGWQKIFSFTLIQYIKTKSFIIGTIIMCVIVAAICTLSNLLPVWISGDDWETSTENPDANNPLAELTAVYLYDETGLLEDSDRELIPSVTATDKSLKDMVDTLKTAENKSVAIQATLQKDSDGKFTGYSVTSYYSEPCDTDAVDTLNNLAQEVLHRRVLLNAGVSPDKYADTQFPISVSRMQAGGESSNFIMSAMNYFVPVVISLLLFILIFSYGQVVAQSIATEKTSRVMELLLTSVRPLAVVIGKVLAMGVVSFAQFILIGIVGGASAAISAPFGMLGKAFEIANDPKIQEALQQATSNLGAQTTDMQIAEAMNMLSNTFSVWNILVIIVIFLLGFVFFSLIAALIGASISRMEDLQQAMQPYALLGVLGVYLAYFPVIFNADALANDEVSINPVQMFSYFFPISSPFSLPSAVLLGTLSPVQIIGAVAVLAAVVVLVAIVVSKVYEAIILHNGNRIKLGEIFKMAMRK